MSREDDTGNAVRILSLDSGGPGTYSQLLLIKEFTSRLAADSGADEDDIFPADYFDLMGGTGFGGLAAILLGHLRMNVEQAIDALLTIACAAFPGDPQPVVDPELNAKNLREAVEGMLQDANIPLDTKMNDQRGSPTKCRVVLYAVTSTNMGHPRAFRTYPSRGSGLNPTVVDAICATISTPSLFSPTKIGPRLRQQLFVGSPAGANNPIRELLKEAGTLFGTDRRVCQIVSIGSGLGRVPSLDSPEGTTNAEKLLTDMGADCETVAKEMSSRLFNVDTYLRLNVDRGMEGLSLTDWRDMGAIESHTSVYAESTAVMKALGAVLRRIRSGVGTITLGQLNNTSAVKITANKQCGRLNEAERLEVEILEQQRRSLGSEHPDTVDAAEGLAATYSLQGQWNEAEQLQVEVLEWRRQHLGKEHPDTMLAEANLAVIYRDQGRWREAEQLGTEVLERRNRISGKEHPQTIQAAANLAYTYREQERWAEAEQLEKEVLEQRRRTLGRNHLGTVLAAGNLTATYVHQKRWDEAMALGVGVVEHLREAVGVEHPYTIFATGYMAIAYRNQGRCSEAEQLEIQVLEQRRRLFGKEHPDTIFAAENLARTYDKQGRWEEAAALLASAVELNMKVIGQHHPKAQRCIKDLELVYEKLGKEKEAQGMRDLLLT